MSGQSWASAPEYSQYWRSVRGVEDMVAREGEEARVARQGEAYWRALAVGLDWENTQLHLMVR